MPATIPTHPVAVLPLKLAYPRRFDGVALVVGSMAPDVAYTTAGLGVVVHSHTWHSVFWFSIPVTLAIATVVRAAAPHVAAHLPSRGPLALGDYGVLGAVRHPLGVTVCSALVGASSHLLWDSVTHPYILAVHPFLGGQTSLPALHRVAWAGLPWWRVVQLVSDAVGLVAAVAIAVHIGRRRLLVDWHGPAPTVRRRPALFWSVAAATAVVVTIAVLALPGNDIGPNVIGVRLIGAGAVTLLVAAAAVRSGPAREPQGSRAAR
jgi:hypothetical protein